MNTTLENIIVKVVLLMFLIHVALTQFQFTNEEFAMPVISLFQLDLKRLSSLLIAVLSILLLTSIFKTSRLLILLTVLTYSLLCISDLAFFHVTPYFYVLILLAYLIDKTHNSSLNSIILILSATYIWSGLGKFANEYFLYGVPFLVSSFSNTNIVGALSLTLFAAPIVEIALGVMLLFRKSYKTACFSLIMMHLCILVLLIRLDLNFIVWPWNLCIIILLLLLLGREKRISSFPKILIPLKILIIPLVVLPLLAQINLVDQTFGFNLFSSRANQLSFKLNEKNALNLISLEDKLKQSDDGKFILHAQIISDQALNLPLHDSFYYQKRFALKLCKQFIEPSNASWKIKVRRIIFNERVIISKSCLPDHKEF